MADMKVAEAVKELGMSKFWIYRLPKDTPGLYFYGRALRVNVEELREWAREQAKGTHESLNPQPNDPARTVRGGTAAAKTVRGNQKQS